MSGSASFNSKFEVTPMREPIQRKKGRFISISIIGDYIFNSDVLKLDSILSVDAPEFVPRVCTIESPRTTQAAPQLYHRNQPPIQIINQNAYRNSNHGPNHQYPVNILSILQIYLSHAANKSKLLNTIQGHMFNFEISNNIKIESKKKKHSICTF